MMRIIDDTLSDWRFWAFGFVVMVWAIAIEVFLDVPNTTIIPNVVYFPSIILISLICLGQAILYYPKKEKLEPKKK